MGCFSRFNTDIKAKAVEDLKDQGVTTITEDLIFSHIVGELLERRKL